MFKAKTGFQFSSFTCRASSRASWAEIVMHLTCTHMFSTQSPRKNVDNTSNSRPPRQVLTCRVKLEDFHRKPTAPIRLVVFNFIALSVMHGHNRRAEIAFPCCPAPAGKRGAIMRLHTLRWEQIEDAWRSQSLSLRQTDVTDVLAASFNKWGWYITHHMLRYGSTADPRHWGQLTNELFVV